MVWMNCSAVYCWTAASTRRALHPVVVWMNPEPAFSVRHEPPTSPDHVVVSNSVLLSMRGAKTRADSVSHSVFVLVLWSTRWGSASKPAGADGGRGVPWIFSGGGPCEIVPPVAPRLELRTRWLVDTRVGGPSSPWPLGALERLVATRSHPPNFAHDDGTGDSQLLDSAQARKT